MICIKSLYGRSQCCSQCKKVGAGFPEAGPVAFISLIISWDHCSPRRACWSSEKRWERGQGESTCSQRILPAQAGSSASCCACPHPTAGYIYSLLLRRKAMTNLGSVLKSRDITLTTKVCIVRAMVFPVVMYGCECWTIKKSSLLYENRFLLYVV